MPFGVGKRATFLASWRHLDFASVLHCTLHTQPAYCCDLLCTCTCACTLHSYNMIVNTIRVECTVQIKWHRWMHRADTDLEWHANIAKENAHTHTHKQEVTLSKVARTRRRTNNVKRSQWRPHPTCHNTAYYHYYWATARTHTHTYQISCAKTYTRHLLSTFVRRWLSSTPEFRFAKIRGENRSILLTVRSLLNETMLFRELTCVAH